MVFTASAAAGGSSTLFAKKVTCSLGWAGRHLPRPRVTLHEGI
jgi:hypothetical protein